MLNPIDTTQQFFRTYLAVCTCGIRKAPEKYFVYVKFTLLCENITLSNIWKHIDIFDFSEHGISVIFYCRTESLQLSSIYWEWVKIFWWKSGWFWSFVFLKSKMLRLCGNMTLYIEIELSTQTRILKKKPHHWVDRVDVSWRLMNEIYLLFATFVQPQ